MTPSIIVLVAFVFALAGLVKGTIGLGLPTVVVGLLSTVMAPTEAAALVFIPSLITNIWQLAAGPALRPLLRRLWPLLGGICIGTWAGSGLLTGDASGRATLALGVALIAYALVGLAAPRLRLPSRAENWVSPWIGAATGLITAATGVFVIPAVPFLQALAFDREELVQALGLSFTVSTIALGFSLAGYGAFAPAIVGTSLLALLPAVAGMLAGQWLRTRVTPATFRLWFFLGLLLLGLDLAVHAGA